MSLMIDICDLSYYKQGLFASSMARKPQDTAKEQGSISLGHDILGGHPKWTRCGSFSSNSNDSSVFCSKRRMQDITLVKLNEGMKRNRNSSGSSSSSNLSYQSDKDAKKTTDTVSEDVKVEDFSEFELKQETIDRLAFAGTSVAPFRHNLRRNIRKKKCSCDCTATCTTLVMRRYKEIGQKTVEEETVISRKVQTCVKNQNPMIDYEEAYSPGKADNNKKRRSEVEKLYDSLHEIEWAKNFSPDNILRQINVRQAASCSMFGRSPTKNDEGHPKKTKRLKGNDDLETKTTHLEFQTDKDALQLSRSTRSSMPKSPSFCNQNLGDVKHRKHRSRCNQAIPLGPSNADDPGAIHLIHSPSRHGGTGENTETLKVKNCTKFLLSSPASMTLNNHFELANGLIPNSGKNETESKELISEHLLAPTFYYMPEESIRTVDACFREVGAEVVVSTCYETNTGLPLLTSVKDCKVPDKIAVPEDLPPVLEPCISYQIPKNKDSNCLKDCVLENTPIYFPKSLTVTPVKEECKQVGSSKENPGDEFKNCSFSRPGEGLFLFDKSARFESSVPRNIKCSFSVYRSGNSKEGLSENQLICKNDSAKEHITKVDNLVTNIGCNPAAANVNTSSDIVFANSSVLRHISTNLVNFAGNILPKLEGSHDGFVSKTSSPGDDSNPDSEKCDEDFHVKGFVMFRTSPCKESPDCNTGSMVQIEDNSRDSSNPRSEKSDTELNIDRSVDPCHKSSYSNSKSNYSEKELPAKGFVTSGTCLHRDGSIPSPITIHSEKDISPIGESMDSGSENIDSEDELPVDSFVSSKRSLCCESEEIEKDLLAENVTYSKKSPCHKNSDPGSESEDNENEFPAESFVSSERSPRDESSYSSSESENDNEEDLFTKSLASKRSPSCENSLSEKELPAESFVSSERSPSQVSLHSESSNSSSGSCQNNLESTEKESSVVNCTNSKSSEPNCTISSKEMWDKSIAEFISSSLIKDTAKRIRNKYLAFLRKQAESSFETVSPKFYISRRDFMSPKKERTLKCENQRGIYKSTISDLSAIRTSDGALERITDRYSPCDQEITNRTGCISNIPKSQLEVNRRRFNQLNAMVLYRLPRRQEIEEESDTDDSSAGPCVDKFEPETITCTNHFQTIDVHRHRDYVQVVLNYTHGNASYLTQQSLGELWSVVVRANQDPQCDMLILNGIGRSFSLGLDIGPLLGPNKTKDAKGIALAIKNFIEALSEFKKPLVAIVNGEAQGLAVTLLSHADTILASEHATFSMPQSLLGYFPEGGATLTLPRAVGSTVAMDLIMRGRTITAREAQSIGLISEIYEEERLPSEIIARVRMLSRMSLSSMETTKAMLKLHFRPQLLSVLENEVKILPQMWLSDSCQEAMKASRRGVKHL